MLSRLVRTQLVIFGVLSIVGIIVMTTVYMQVPTLLGIGRYTITLELPASGGLYQFSNVTYRGVQIGKVTKIDLAPVGTRATLSVQTSPRIPTDLRVEVRSVSAVGEQYVDLQPRDDSGPYLGNGSVIPATSVTLPQKVGPMLDQVNDLLASIPKERFPELLDETSRALNGAGFDLGSLFDSSATLGDDLARQADAAARLTNDSAPLLDGQVQAADSLREWTRNLAGITTQIADNDESVRDILRTAPDTLAETSGLLEDLQPTLPILLSNLTTVGQIAVTYRPGLEQLLVLLPPYLSALQTFALPWNNPTGLPLGDFTATSGDPVACTVGFLPPSAWRPPTDTTEVDTPDGLYCKLPQDSPIAVRGARNTPCMEQPGKRAPTVDLCRSDKPWEPIAMRQHALGPYPLDPNLIAQGVPPDSRITPDEGIYAPVEGTPMPPGAPTVPGAGPQMPPPSPTPSAPATPSGAPAGYSAQPRQDLNGRQPLAFAEYDPATGRYVTADGRTHQQTDLAAPPESWRDLMPN